MRKSDSGSKGPIMTTQGPTLKYVLEILPFNSKLGFSGNFYVRYGDQHHFRSTLIPIKVCMDG